MKVKSKIPKFRHKYLLIFGVSKNQNYEKSKEKKTVYLTKKFKKRNQNKTKRKEKGIWEINWKVFIAN